MKVIKLLPLFFLILIIISNVKSAVEEDLITKMPSDYLYDTVKNKMYSGYLNIKQTPTKKLHYVFVQSQGNPATDPLVLWYNGGPGCSSLLGLSDENGPTFFEENTKIFQKNKYSWNRLANMLYIEAPAGVGFSIAQTENDYYTNDVLTGSDNLAALLDWFEKYPEYKTHKFYISGESYAGIYIPYVATNILNYNLSVTADKAINLKGIIVGNGVVDWSVDTDPALLDFSYEHGLYNIQTRNEYEKYCPNVDQAKCDAVKTLILETYFAGTNIYDIYRKCFKPPPEKMFLKENSEEISYSNKKYNFNYTPWLKDRLNEIRRRYYASNSDKNLTENLKDETPECADGIGSHWWYNRDDVKDALHVDKGIHFQLCNDKFQTTYYRGTTGSFYLYPELLASGIKIWIYSGDTDGAVPTIGTRRWIQKLQLPTIEKYRPWKIPEDSLSIAGYVEKYESLTFVIIKGTGHMVPQWKRAEAFHMLDCYLNDKDI